MKKKSEIPKELQVIPVFKQSASVFGRNLLTLFSVAIAIDFLLYQLFSNVTQWMSNKFEFDISPAKQVLVFTTTTIFLIFAFYRLAIDVLEPNSKSNIGLLSFHKIFTFIWPQDNSQWKSLLRIAGITFINWVAIAIGISIVVLAIDVASWMHDSMSSLVFWISMAIIVLLSFFFLVFLTYIGVRIWLSIPIIVTEDMTIRDAILHSWKITKSCSNYLLRLNCIIVSIFLFPIAMFLSYFINFVLSLIGISPLAAQTITTILLDAIVSGFFTTVTAVCFYRVKKLQDVSIQAAVSGR